ncbi:MAG: peptidylprolyl isomerase [Pseudomonadota bacterium]|nr:peptidylprolyl isomerase [Pseudomonadota bacterium]
MSFVLLLVSLAGFAAAEDPQPGASAPVPSKEEAAVPAAAVPAAAVPAIPAPAPVPVDSSAAAPAAAAGVVVDRVAAVVNEDIITLSEVYAFGGSYIEEVIAARGAGSRASAEAEVVERLLERQLVEQEMTALKLDLVDQDVDSSIADIAERNGMDIDGLRKEVERSGMGWDQYRSELKENLRDMKFAQTVLRPRVNVTEDELRDAWLRASPTAPATARVQALVLMIPPGATEAERQSSREAVLARARSLRDEARAGGDFAALSRANDQGPFGEQGGEMGVFKPGELVDTLDSVIVNTPVGEVSDPIVIGDGVYLLRVAERISAANDFEARRAEVSEQVFQSRLEDEKERWFQEARRRAVIRILLPGASQASPGASLTQ